MVAAAASVPDDPRFVLLRAPAPDDDFASDVRTGLTAAHKWLPPRWFYDELGSSLFDTICFLPEYYVMRAEAEVLTTYQAEIAAALGTHVRLVELGSGAARKTRILFDALTAKQPDLEYVPVDVDASMLERAGRDLLREYEALRIIAVRSDFARPSVPLSLLPRTRARTVILFLGSTIGNLNPAEATAMLRDLRASLSKGDALLLGVDLRKSRDVLEPAYDDPLGVTAAFNLNVLGRINRELGGEFDLRSFHHQARYNRELGRVEMHLESLRDQVVPIRGINLEARFRAGETIHTESSHKFDPEQIAEL